MPSWPTQALSPLPESGILSLEDKSVSRTSQVRDTLFFLAPPLDIARGFTPNPPDLLPSSLEQAHDPHKQRRNGQGG
jgi:hypothetical protein